MWTTPYSKVFYATSEATESATNSSRLLKRLILKSTRFAFGYDLISTINDQFHVLQVSTFNLNGRKPPEDLDFEDFVKKWEASWPKREKIGTGSHRKPDLYILGFQEAVPLTAQNIIAGFQNCLNFDCFGLRLDEHSRWLGPIH